MTRAADLRRAGTSVCLQTVSLGYGAGVRALDRIDLDVKAGEFLTVVGPSGSGKTTLLRVIAGLETGHEGDVRFDGVSVRGHAPRDRRVALVFQHPTLYPHLNVLDNLAFGIRAAGGRGPSLRARVHEVAAWLGLTDLLGRKPGTLSGGQKQRVALGRAVARDPVVLMLDEPFSALDSSLRESIRNDLRALHGRLGTTVIHVTHDPAEALGLGDRVAVLCSGRLEQVGTPQEVYRHPRSRRVAQSLGDPPMTFLPGRVDRSEGTTALSVRGVLLRSSGQDRDPPGVSRLALAVGRTVEVGMRPESVLIQLTEPPASGPPNRAWFPRPGRVTREEYRGDRRLTHVALDTGDLLVAPSPAGEGFRLDDEVFVGLDVDRIWLFDPDGGQALGPS